jgi:hypothetical protein
MRILSMALVAVLAFCSASASAANFKPIDCGSSSFAFSGATYNVDCERSDDPLRVGSSTGSATTDVMAITSDDRTIFLTMVSRLITAPRIYMQHSNLGDSFRAVFDDKGVKDWKSLGNKDGYDVAEFTTDISGRESHCITAQFYSNAAHTGFKRHVIGMGCTLGEIGAVYQLLGQIDAPGD